MKAWGFCEVLGKVRHIHYLQDIPTPIKKKKNESDLKKMQSDKYVDRKTKKIELN